MFGHPLHGPEYEARLPTGHGARWAVPAVTFMGFVEPFEAKAADGDATET